MDDLISRLAGRRVVVIGDVMLDHFIFGSVDRISPEAPVPVVRFVREEYRLGGAANVAHNVAALGGQAAVIGIVGDDLPALELRSRLDGSGISGAGLVIDQDRQTTRKVRIVTQRNQQVARVDYETDTNLSAASEDRLIAQVQTLAAEAHAVVVSDYNKGVASPGIIAAAINAARRANVPVLIDPKVPQAERYRGASLITPNNHEAELMTQMAIRTDDDVREAARRLGEKTGANVLITRGEHGMWVMDRTEGRVVEEALPAAAREVSDVTGAGDTVIAVLALALAAGGSLLEAARLANLAAGLVVAHFGPAAPTAAELRTAASQTR